MKNKTSLVFCKCFLIYAFTFLITSSLLFSCKKEKNNPPEISIQLPSDNIALNAIDSVYVRASVKDDDGPVSLSVYIADAELNPVTTIVSKSASGNSLNFDQFYYFNNLYLQSGIYYLVVHADDGLNKINKTVRVNISEIPKVLKSVYVGVKDVSGMKMFCSDSLGNFSQVGFVSATCLDFVINNYSQQIFVLCNNGNLLCYSLPEFELQWERSGLNLLGNAFDGELTELNNLIYVTDAKGYIKAFDETGTIRKVSNVTLGSPVRFNFCDGKTITYVYNYNNQHKYIQTLSSDGGTINTYLVPFTPGRFFSYSMNNVLVFGSSQGQTNIYTYNTEISLLSPFGSTISGDYCDALETPDGKYLVSTTDEINTIEKDYGYLTLFAAGHKANKMNFESLSGLLYVADSNNLKVFQYPLAQIVSLHDFNNKIMYFDFQYNK